MAESTHQVEVVPIVLEPHPDADSLSIVRVFDGYTCVVRTADWQGVDRAAYIPPDNIVPDSPQFAFLGSRAKDRRIKAKRLRGIWSIGLLVPAPEGFEIGDDVTEHLGITHYQPKASATSRPGSNLGKSLEAAPPPGCGSLGKYDLEAFRKYGRRAFVEGEDVFVTEKIHGCNARYVCVDGVLHAGSRTRWTKDAEPDERNIWWRALHATPSLDEFLRRNEGMVVYGEVYGQVMDLRYGHVDRDVSFAAFDLRQGSGRWFDWDVASAIFSEAGVPQVPSVFCGAFEFDKIMALADGQSLIPGANHLREGIVVRPALERFDDRAGRVVLKLVSNDYLARS